jgi:hypothetical protein
MFECILRASTNKDMAMVYFTLHSQPERKHGNCKKKKKTPWPESASELYRPSDRRLSAKLVLTFEDRGCHVVSVMNPYGRNLGFLDRHGNCNNNKISGNVYFFKWECFE